MSRNRTKITPFLYIFLLDLWCPYQALQILLSQISIFSISHLLSYLHLLIRFNGKKSKIQKIKKLQCLLWRPPLLWVTRWRGSCRRLGRDGSTSPLCLPRSFQTCGFCWRSRLPEPCWSHCSCGKKWARTQSTWCWSGVAQPQVPPAKAKAKATCSLASSSTLGYQFLGSLCSAPHPLPVPHPLVVLGSWKPEHSSEHRGVI